MGAPYLKHDIKTIAKSPNFLGAPNRFALIAPLLSPAGLTAATDDDSNWQTAETSSGLEQR